MRKAPLLLFAILAYATFRGVLPHLGEAFIGRYYVDAWGTQWFFWFIEHAVWWRDGVAESNLFFYPWGKDIYGHTGGNFVDAVLAAPLLALLGQVWGYNTFVGLIVGSNVLAMRRLLRELEVGPFAAWTTGVLFAFNPFLLTEIRDGRPTQALLAFALLFWTYWLRAGKSWKSAIAAGFFLALTGLTYWYYAILAAPAGGALFFLDRDRTTLTRRLGAAAIAAAFAAPFALGMLTAGHVVGLLDVSRWSATTWSPMTNDGQAVGILSFEPLDRMSGFWVIGPDGDNVFLLEAIQMLRAQMVLGALGLWAGSPRQRKLALAVLIPSLLIALGPEWLGVPNTPYLLAVKYIRILQRLWWPARAMVYVHVGLMMLSAPFWERLAVWPRSRLALLSGITLSWLVDLHVATLVPMAGWSASVPDIYKCIAKDETRAPLIELPYGYSQAHLYYQTLHQHPIFGGMIEDNKIFTPPEQQAIREKNSFIKALIDIGDEKNTPREVTDSDKQAIRDLGFQWVMLDKVPFQNPPPLPEIKPRTHYGEVKLALTGILGEPVYEDDSGILWAPWGGESPCGVKRAEKKRPGFRRHGRAATPML